MARERARSIYRFTVNEYANRKGEPRIAVLMSRAEASMLAKGENNDVRVALEDALAAVTMYDGMVETAEAIR